jgi:drug/metabolite transporter (DMT)-like permease
MAALRGKALVAYLVVCVFWGSTYLAIKVGVGELPPFLFAGLRFLVAGVLLLGLALALGDKLPRERSDWRTQAIVGVLLLAGGNAFVVWAEQYTSSGTASIFVVTVALWMAFFDAVIPGGSGELGWRVIAGLVLGFLGTGLLVGANPAEILHADLRGPIALTCASASWSLGSVYGKRHKTATSPYVGAAVQMLAGGGAVVLLGTTLGPLAFDGQGRGSGGLPRRVRLDPGLQRLHVRAAPRFAHNSRDVRLREPGDRSAARLAHFARAGDGADVRRHGVDRRSRRVDPVLA